MLTKNLVVCNYNINIITKIIKKFRLIKIIKLLTRIPILFLVIISLISITNFYNSLNSVSNKDISVADFKLDINRLRETSAIIEIERVSNKHTQINNFGSDGILLNVDEINSGLATALTNIADVNADGTISNEEIWNLGLMRLKADSFKKELRDLQFSLSSADCNLKNYIIITRGEFAGTILYNGSLKFIDSQNKQYFGLELFI